MNKFFRVCVMFVVIGIMISVNSYLESVNVRIARVVTITGNVEVQRSHTGEWIPAEHEMRLYEGDVVRTRSGSKVVIQLDDGSMAQLTSLSTMKIERLNKSLRGQSTDLGVEMGKSWTKVKKASSVSSKFNVSTPTAVAGVRGTYFSTEVEEQTVDSTFDVFDGQVDVYQKEDPTQVVSVRQNFRTEVKKGSNPTEPKKMSTEELNKGLADGISWGSDSESSNYDMKIDVYPHVLMPGEKGVVTLRFYQNGKPYNGSVIFVASLGGSATFISNGSQTLEVVSNEKGEAKVEVTDSVKEQIILNADVSFLTQE